MKRYILTIAFAIGLGLNLNAQSQQNTFSDGFFSSNYSEYREEELEWGKMPLLPGNHGYTCDYDAEKVPLGSGLLILAGMGLGYAMRKRKEN